MGEKGSTGRIWLDLQHSLQVRWQADVWESRGHTSLELERPGIGRVVLQGNVLQDYSRGTIAPAELGGHEPLVHVVVHWLNLPSIQPSDLIAADGAAWPGRTVLSGAGWSMTMDEHPGHDTAAEAMRDRCAFALTHVAELRRQDGGAFSPEEAADILFAYQVALSFALGRWVAPALPIGFGADGRVEWEQWAPWRCDTYSGFVGWWSSRAAEDLAEYVGLFLGAWSDDQERPVLRHLVMHAISANHGGTTVEARVMLAQAAMEYLGWVQYVLRDGGAAEDNKPAYAVLRRLLSEAGIDPAIPEELSALREVLQDPALDGPRAATWMRNRLVHPKDAAQPYLIQDALLQTWQLSLHYLALLVLNRLGFRGAYLRRFPPGRYFTDTEQVPWAVATRT